MHMKQHRTPVPNSPSKFNVICSVLVLPTTYLLAFLGSMTALLYREPSRLDLSGCVDLGLELSKVTALLFLESGISWFASSFKNEWRPSAKWNQIVDE